jgi:hypothetical protein
VKKPPDEERQDWSSVEESIQRKHTRYRQRFKQGRRILAEEVPSSPLVPEDLSELQELMASELRNLHERLAAERGGPRAGVSDLPHAARLCESQRVWDGRIEESVAELMEDLREFIQELRQEVRETE